MLEQYRIADFIEWNKEKKLKLDPDFQRGSVWSPAARVFLIDTILRKLPIPKIYLRTRIDTTTQASVREVVDGQQRLRAILDFASNKFRLSSRTKEFSGASYSSLTDEFKAIFLEYPIAVEQLVNASDNDVLEIFSRLNSYNVSLNPAEKRHAKFQGKFKWQVRELSTKWSMLWTDLDIISTRQRVRKEDDSTIAQILMLLDDGVSAGGANKIEKYYKTYDDEYIEGDQLGNKLDQVLTFFMDNIGEELIGTKLLTGPQFLILIAALAHRIFGIPNGEIESGFPDGATGIEDILQAIENLKTLAAALESEEPPEKFQQFVTRSLSTTQGMLSRKERFLNFYHALGNQPI